MIIRELLKAKERERFVGREAELSRMRQCLADEREEWRLLHLHAPGGMGKSALLIAFAHANPDIRCFYLDGHEGLIHTAAFCGVLRRLLIQAGGAEEHQPEPTAEVVHGEAGWLAEQLNKLAEHRLVVLQFDTFEQWTLLEEWLRTVWLPLLSPRVRVCTASRFPLAGGWLRGGWAALVTQMTLGTLPKPAIQDYIGRHGIREPRLALSIERFSGGLPLALTLACEAARYRQDVFFAETPERSVLIGRLLGVIFGDVQNPQLQKYLDAVSIFWRFNQELLEQVLGETVPPHDFREFCRLPFVVAGDDGWRLHDLVRQWAETDFRRRAPETMEVYRQRARAILKRRLITAAGGEKVRLLLERLYLFEHDLMRCYLFAGSGGEVQVRDVRAQDIARLQLIIRQYYRAVPPFLPDDIKQEKWIGPLWQAVPAAFKAFWVRDELVGLSSFLPLTDEVRRIMREIPAFAGYLATARRREREYVLWLGGLLPEHLADAQSATLRDMLKNFYAARLVTVITSLSDFYPIMDSLGFGRLPQADYVSPGGIRFQAYQLDLGETDFAARIDRQLDHILSAAADPRPTFERLLSLVKDGLAHYRTLEDEEALLRELAAILPDNYKRTMDHPAAAFRAWVTAGLERIATGKTEDKLHGRLLRLAYVQKAGSHEQAAERLQLAQSTYYRHLKKAVLRLVQLMEEELR